MASARVTTMLTLKAGWRSELGTCWLKQLSEVRFNFLDVFSCGWCWCLPKAWSSTCQSAWRGSLFSIPLCPHTVSFQGIYKHKTAPTVAVTWDIKTRKFPLTSRSSQWGVIFCPFYTLLFRAKVLLKHLTAPAHKRENIFIYWSIQASFWKSGCDTEEY